MAQIQINPGNKTRERGHKRSSRKKNLYEPAYYKRVTENNESRKQKQFTLNFDLLPEWCLRGVHLPAGAVVGEIRIIKGQYSKEAFDSEVNPNGTNQYGRHRSYKNSSPH